MAVEVLLMTDVEDLGKEGDVVQVADGYARNYLCPRKLAAPLTRAARARLEKIRRDRERTQQEQLASAREGAAALAGASCTIAVKTGEDGKLYGSVTVADVAEALNGQGFGVDRRQILMEGPIRELGVFEVAVRLHADIQVPVKVWVVEE